MQLYRDIVRPQLFARDPEDIHHLTIAGLAGISPLAHAAAHKAFAPRHPMLQQTLWGTVFASPIGLAAGLDKNAEAVMAWGGMGFGFAEVGTVTPRAQSGNPRPRLFRLPEDKAFINRMGFNNKGAEAMHRRLMGPRLCPVWVNIGKNKNTAQAHAAQDYRFCVQALHGVADALVVNVSSPNTPGLRDLQSAEALAEILGVVLNEAERQRVHSLRHVPVLLKLAPDLAEEDFVSAVASAKLAGVSGLVISNTTLSREGLHGEHKGEAGGLSGAPLRQRSTELVRLARKVVGPELPIVGVGGVFSTDDAYEKITAGATLVQVYSGFIYGGPELPAQLAAGLVRRLQADGFAHISEAVGSKA